MRSLRARIVGGSLLLALLVGIPFVALIGAIDQLRQSAELSARGEAVTASTRELERLVLDLETGLRGYAIAGNREFLQPLQNARERLPERLARLESFVLDEEQRRRAALIDASIRSYLDEWIVPLVAEAEEDREEAARSIARGGGKARIDELRAAFAEFEEAQASVSAARAEQVEGEARRAITMSFGGLAGSAILLFLFGGYLLRAVVRPVRRTADSAMLLAAGDLSARTARGGPLEVDELAASFNTMADSLEESRDELESQNAELEAQAVELEQQQSQLVEANDELAAQQTELERTFADLTAQKEQLETHYSFAELLTRETRIEPLAQTVLAQIADVVDAEIGAVYVVDAVDEEEEDLPCPVGARGLVANRLRAIQPGDGLAARAFSEQRIVGASYGETGLELAVFGEDVAVRHELHAPLVHAGESVGILTLARVGARPFTADEQQTLEHLANQAAVALANALVLRRAERLTSLNRTVLDSTPAGILLVDREGKTVLANATFERLAETDGSARNGSIYDQLEESAERMTDPEAYRDFMRALADDPERAGMLDVTERGGERAFHLYTAPVRNSEAEEPRGRIFVVEDVTAERQAEKLKSDLISTVSHELRTPLASIVGFSELLATRELGAATSKSYLGTIHSEAQRLTKLIDDLLDLQRVEAGGLRVELESIDLVPLLRQSVELYSGQSTAHTIELDVPAERLTVLAESERISQVVGNLLSNAIKYSPAGGDVVVRAVAEPGSIRISVRDEGLGIPASQKGQIFEKFFRVDTSDTRRIGGTGLGLALSREIIEAHGGSIGFDSVEGEGSTFWFELPFGQHPPGRGGILVIGDEAASAALLASWLSEDGHHVEVASSEEEGLERAVHDQPSVICLDVGSRSRLDSWRILETLKGQPATSTIPIVVCTANNGNERAAALGAADVLAKPFSSEQLRTALLRVLPASGGDVLVVDDDPAVRRLVFDTLVRDGVRLREAANGKEALASVAKALPDAIVLDLLMPELDGFDVLATLRRDPATRDIPVVVLTAKRLTRTERAQLRRGTVALMEKNAYSALELRSLVQAALGS